MQNQALIYMLLLCSKKTPVGISIISNEYGNIGNKRRCKCKQAEAEDVLYLFYQWIANKG